VPAARNYLSALPRELVVGEKTEKAEGKMGFYVNPPGEDKPETGKAIKKGNELGGRVVSTR
jgi:hypothetical protein